MIEKRVEIRVNNGIFNYNTEKMMDKKKKE